MNSNFNVSQKKVNDNFSAFLVENADFTGFEELPVLDEKRIPKTLPKYIIPFNKIKEFKGNKKECAICFYWEDERFSNIRKCPRKYINLFSSYHSIIGFDFSIHTDMQRCKQIDQMNENLSLTYFYGENGSFYIPNIRCGNEDTIDEFLECIPKQSIIAIGTYGFIKSNEEQYEWLRFLERVLPILEPKYILVYGTLNGNIFNEIRKKYNFIFYKPWIKNIFKEVK